MFRLYRSKWGGCRGGSNSAGYLGCTGRADSACSIDEAAGGEEGSDAVKLAGLAARPATPREAACRRTTPSYAVNPEGSRVKLGHYRVAGGRSRRRAPLGGRPRRVAGQEVTSMNAAWPSEVLYCSARG